VLNLTYKVLLSLKKKSRILITSNKPLMKHSKKKKVAIQHFIPNNPQADQQLTGGGDWDAKAEADAKKNTLYDSSYKTAAGHWKQRDEPTEPKKTEYLKVAPDALWKQKQWSSRQRLKQKPGGVPTRQGKKLFDEFMKEALSRRL
jgi:hypothetical protein